MLGKLPLERGHPRRCRPTRDKQKIRKGHIFQGGKVPEDILANPLLKNRTHARWPNKYHYKMEQEQDLERREKCHLLCHNEKTESRRTRVGRLLCV